MKEFKLKLLMVCALALLLNAPVTLGDWNPGDPYKMHFPQMPDPEGWDACVCCQWIADDFGCTETGPITDIHFWTSWKEDKVGDVGSWDISIWSDRAGQPGVRIWTWNGLGNVTTRLYGAGYQGWVCPSPPPLIVPQDHHNYYQVNITNIPPDPEPFIQQAGTIYWLVIRANITPLPSVGWKTSVDVPPSPLWQSPALWSTDLLNWSPVDTGVVAPELHDMAFVITGGVVEPELEYGDAPEGPKVLAYPATGVTGSFPTCRTSGPAGWIQHNNFGAWFGPSFDFELDGDAGLCPPPGCFPPYNADECYLDGDAGLIIPEPYTIDAAGNVVPCPTCNGTPLGRTCQTAVWGVDVDIDIHNWMPSHEPYVPGYVNVLMDWNQDGIWAGFSNCPTAAAPEHVLVNFVIPPKYDGPLSALNPPNFLIGPNPGYVWARFTITEKPVPIPLPGWDGSGSFEDGESEDYLVYVAPSGPKPLIEHSKWSQPPVEINPGLERPVYSGWDEPSLREFLPDMPQEFWHLIADDFRCLGNMPIASIHWWGSHFGWEYQEPGVTPPVPPIGWKIGFWSNVAANPDTDPNYSYPQVLLWQIEVDADRVEVQEVGTDYYHDYYPRDICYQYTLHLEPEEYFWQYDFNEVTQDDVFWLSIAALYPSDMCEPPYYPWGWKTRPWSWMDDAVRFGWDGPLEPGIVLDPYNIWPIVDPLYGESFDVAFELDTDPNYIKWEQHYTGIRIWEHYEDEFSMATVERWVEPITKWIQKPDLSDAGIDVDATEDLVWKPQVLADDFPCEFTGPITNIHIWGSWYHDHPPFNDPTAVVFTLSIHADIPADASPTGYSMPGKLLWKRDFQRGEFDVQEFARIQEGWYVPCAEPPYYDPYADNICWFYMFSIPVSEAFVQQVGNIYWLDVQARPNPEPGFPELIRFGWKNTPTIYHWNDDAVWAVGEDPPAGLWNELRYPLGHRYEGQTVDLAFEIITDFALKYAQPPDLQPETSIDIDATKDVWQPQLLADDFPCEMTEPITDIHIWGSWYHDIVPYGDSHNVILTLSIHEDLPIGDPRNPNPYSMPGKVLWMREFWPGEFDVSVYARYLDEGWLVPCSEPPYYEPGADSICWQYDFYIDAAVAFIQQAGNIYWLDVQARPFVPAGAPPEPMRTRFGWKTTPPEYHWNDDAVWAVGTEREHGPWNELRYPLGHPYEGHTADLAFAITSEKEYEEFVIHQLVADDWSCQRRTPVTALAWWGSYLGYEFKPCHGPFMPLPVKPDYFWLGVWTDAPANPDDTTSYSHPNDLIWEYKAYDYDEVLVGYDKYLRGGLDVVICGAPMDPNWNNDVQAKLLATGQFNTVDIIDVSRTTGSTPTLAQLQAYDAALVYSDNPAYADSNALGNVMADYVDSGGGVVCMMFEIGYGGTGYPGAQMQGRWNAQGYYAIPRTGQYAGHATLGTVYDTTHPIMQGVSSFDGGTSSFRPDSNSISAGSVRVADWSDGRPLVVTKTIGGVPRADLGFYPPSIDARSDFWVSSTDGALLMANALTWVASGPTAAIPREPVFRYSVRLPEDNWFGQREVNDIYWLSVVAVYDRNIPNYDWGWTNHEHVFQDDAVAGHLDPAGPAPVWSWRPLYDQTGLSEDMSFILFTDPDECVDCADYNSDGIVDYRDLKVFVDNWLWTGPAGGYNDADLDCDGDAEFYDFAILALQWFDSCP